MHSSRVFGLVAIKGEIDVFRSLAKHRLERDDEYKDLDFLLQNGGEDWLFNNLMTGPTHGINDNSIVSRIEKFGSNKRKRMSPPCITLVI